MNGRKAIILAGLYLTAICEKGFFQRVCVTGRETKYILTRHEPDIKPPYPSTNMKCDKEERIKSVKEIVE